MADPMSLDDALALLAGVGRVRIPRIQCELRAIAVIRQALADRDARITELETQTASRPEEITE